MILSTMQLLHHERKIKMPCKFRGIVRLILFFIFSDTCITGAYGDIKTIREGIQELEFKP